jgi:hypothetical protein
MPVAYLREHDSTFRKARKPRLTIVFNCLFKSTFYPSRMTTGDYLPERRRAIRTDLRLPGTIQRAEGLAPISCVVVDMSVLGASIRAEDVGFPDEFILSLTANASVIRKCKVVWRDGLACGVEFIPEPKKSKDQPRESATKAAPNRLVLES